MFARITADHTTVHKIRPLCPTRWLVRVDAINALLSQYGSVLDTLDEHVKSPGSNAKASGVLHHLQCSSTVLGLNIAGVILAPLENLNRALQARGASVAGMIESVKVVSEEITAMRTDEFFKKILWRCQDL